MPSLFSQGDSCLEQPLVPGQSRRLGHCGSIGKHHKVAGGMRYNLLLYTFTYRRFYLDHSMYIFPNHVAIKLMGHSILIILFRINFHCPNYGVYIIFTHKCLISEKGLTICKIIKSLKIYKQICKFHTLEQFKYLHT